MKEDDHICNLFKSRSKKNIQKWGLQPLNTLLLCAMEEMGELTQAYLQYRHEDGELMKIHDELIDLGALLIQIHQQYLGEVP
jgi:NTP pyrophosphatase (non-canonical NTP hydrolase)